MKIVLARLSLALVAMLSLSLAFACNRDDDGGSAATPVPDRTAYVGEWAGEFVRSGASKEDDVELTVTTGTASTDLECSILYITDNIRRDFRVTWNGTRNVFEGNDDGQTFSVSQSGTSLTVNRSGSAGNFISTMSDARNKWVGTWTGTLACATGSSDATSWSIQKGSGKTDLTIANTATPGTPFGTLPLTRGEISGQFSTGGKTYQYTANYIDFTGIINVAANQVGASNECTMQLSK